MSRPGTTITRSETRPGRSAPTGTGPWFVVGPTGTADADAAGPRKPIKSLSEYATRFGARAAHVNDGGGGAGLLYDAVDAYFRGGGSECYVSPATYNATELALAVHAEANNRVAILATSNTAVVATLTGEATIASITPGQERVTSLWTPWVTFNSGGVTRTISPEAIVAALMAENDGLGVTPNQPSAGTFGVSSVAESVASAFNDADRATLNTNGVNLLRLMFDGVRVYGYRTLADPTSDSNWVSLANARLFMSIQAQADAVAERFVFRQLDGQRKTINEFGGALTGVLLPFWANGSLYGVTPEEAFRVDVGEAVNTDTTIANKELHAILQLRTSEFAEEVILELVKTRITEGIS
jgi:hypothetical protein